MSINEVSVFLPWKCSLNYLLNNVGTARFLHKILSTATNFSNIKQLKIKNYGIVEEGMKYER